jgi:hypothetical protein
MMFTEPTTSAICRRRSPRSACANSSFSPTQSACANLPYLGALSAASFTTRRSPPCPWRFPEPHRACSAASPLKKQALLRRWLIFLPRRAEACGRRDSGERAGRPGPGGAFGGWRRRAGD